MTNSCTVTMLGTQTIDFTKNGGITALGGHRKQKCGFREGGVWGIRDRNLFPITGL